MQWIKEKMFVLFGLDVRSLALLRIGTALLIIGECIHRAADLVAFSTDAGVLPRSVLIDNLAGQFHISLNLISGTWEVQALLLLLSAVFAVCLLIGWHTRLMTFLSWILLISFQARNPLILQNSDTVLRMILFWGFFLPWGSCASVDSVQTKPETEQSPSVLSVATFAYIVQILLIYVFAVSFKTSPEWQSEFSAVYYALSAGGFVTPAGAYLLHYGTLLPFLTRGVVLFQTWMPFVFFVPFWTQTIRVLLILGAIGMHVGMGLTLELGLFSWIMIVALLGLLPSGFWDAIGAFMRRRHPVCTLYYDGHCGFCNRSARLIAQFLFIPHVTVARADDDKKILAYMQKENSWVFVCNGTNYTRSKAFFMLAKHSPVFGIFARLFDHAWARTIGDTVYDWVSARRKQVCVTLPAAQRRFKYHFALSITMQIVATGFLAYIVIGNITTLPTSTVVIPHQLDWVAQVFRLDQRWDMFSPYPIKETGWFIMPGTLASGQRLDIYTGGIISLDPPQLASRTYKNYRWRKYLMNLADPRFTDYRLYYGRYLCRQWNDTQKDPTRLLKDFDIIYVRERTLPENRKGPVEQTTLWHHQCY